jgi:hypothetical protein
LATSTTFWIPRHTTTTGPTDCRYPEASRSRRWSRASAPTPISSHARARRTPTSCSSITASSGPGRRGRWTGPPSDAWSCSSTPTSPWPPYHLPLDGHLEVGNNALLAGALGAGDLEPFAAHKRATLGVRARFAGAGITPAELVQRVRAATGREPLAFTDGPDPVRTIGIVSGAGADHLEDAIDAGLDAFVTGEPAERSMARAREAGVHFLAAGHYATETFGVRALGDRLAEHFGIRHVFVDVPNPV